MQFPVIVLISHLCLCLVQSSPQYPFYNPYRQLQYYNPYVASYHYNRPYYYPGHTSYPFGYQQQSNSINNQIGDANIIDVEGDDSATNDQLDNWFKSYQNIQHLNQENNQAKQNLNYFNNQIDQQRKQLEDVTRQREQQTVGIVTDKPSEANDQTVQRIIKLADGSGYVLKQVGRSFHETITSKPIVHTFTQTKPIVSHIHRVFTQDNSQPIIKVFYNGKDITDDHDAIDAISNKKLTTQPHKVGIASTTDDDSDDLDEVDDDDDDDDSAPKPITSWVG